MSLGERNNNPGNIKAGALPWEGQTGVDEHGFCVFDTPEHGLRAMARILHNYQLKYGLHSVEGVITRWAPPSENDTEAYIKDVAKRLGVDREDWINLNDPVQMVGLLDAIVHHENGSQPYSMAQLQQGVLTA